MAYQLYLGDVLFPVMPSKIKMKINGKNKTLDLINGQEINVLNPAGLTDIDFDLMLPGTRYPFAQYESGFEPPDYYLDELERMKVSRKPVRFIMIRESPAGDSFFDTNMAVSLEEYSITEDAREGMDITVSIKLKQYVHYGVQRVSVQVKAAPEVTGTEAEITAEEERDASSAPDVSSYAVRERDCLWNIAKRYLGNGSRWQEIYDLNRDKLCVHDLLSAGMVLAMPE